MGKTRLSEISNETELNASVYRRKHFGDQQSMVEISPSNIRRWTRSRVDVVPSNASTGSLVPSSNLSWHDKHCKMLHRLLSVLPDSRARLTWVAYITAGGAFMLFEVALLLLHPPTSHTPPLSHRPFFCPRLCPFIFPESIIRYHQKNINMPDNRVTRPGRHSYNTKSARIRTILTPGGRHVAQKIKKTTKGPICSDCKCSLPGIKHLKRSAYKNLKKRERTVSRAYGGSACGGCVRMRIVRAFLLEEQKAVKKLLAERASTKK